jgi:hypothetical protein
MVDPISLTAIILAGKVVGSTLTLLSVIFGAFKAVNWIISKIQDISTNVVELKTSMDSHITGLREDIKNQTTTIASALGEQRQDFRTFFAPTLLMLHRAQESQPFDKVPVEVPTLVRAKKNPVKRKAK